MLQSPIISSTPASSPITSSALSTSTHSARSTTSRKSSTSSTPSTPTSSKLSTPSKQLTSHHTTSRHHTSKHGSHKSTSIYKAPIYTFEDLQNARLQLARTRRALVSELLSFFPINPSPTATETETVIMNVTMPNNGVYNYYRPDALSTALGYVAHVVFIIACYLGVSYFGRHPHLLPSHPITPFSLFSSLT